MVELRRIAMEQLRDTTMRDRRFVITSTNAKRAAELAATSEYIHEVIGKPYDIDRIVEAVRQAARALPPRERGASG
jgi:DNA-binding NarL/FixJ family response regulator